MSASFQYYILLPANVILDFVLLLFGYTYMDEGMRPFVVGCIAFIFYLYVLKAFIAIFQKLLGFRPTGRG